MTEKKTFERKHFFIDRKFQGRYMVTFLVPMLVLLVFMLFTLYFASQSMISTTTDIIQKDVDIKIDTQLQERAPTVELLQAVLKDVRAYLRDFSNNTAYRRALLTSLLVAFGIGTFVVILQVVLLTIYFSHKVAGPVYRLEKVCHGVLDGDYREEIHLRKGDELQNLAHLLNEAIRSSRERLVAIRDEKDEKKRAGLAASLKL